jgi:hypothetical protein
VTDAELRDPEHLFAERKLVYLIAVDGVDVPPGVRPLLDRYAELQRAADRLTVGVFVERLGDA